MLFVLCELRAGFAAASPCRHRDTCTHAHAHTHTHAHTHAHTHTHPRTHTHTHHAHHAERVPVSSDEGGFGLKSEAP